MTEPAKPGMRWQRKDLLGRTRRTRRALAPAGTSSRLFQLMTTEFAGV